MQGDKAVKLKARLGVPDLQDLAPGVFAALDRPFVAVVVLHRRRRIATAVQFTDRVEERGATEPRLVAVEDNHTVQLEVQHLAESVVLDYLSQDSLGKERQRFAARERHVVLSRSEEHTSELQSLMRISYAVFCLKKNNTLPKYHTHSK